MSRPCMFFRKQTASWYVKIKGKFVPLGKDEKKARTKYQSLLPPEARDDDDDVRTLTSTYLDYLAANRSDGTYQIAVRHLTDFAAYLGDYFPAEDVKGFHLQGWADRRFAGKSDSYKNRGMRAVKCCWSWGLRMGYIAADPLRPVQLPSPGQREDFIPADQWRGIVDAVRDEPFKQYLTVMLESGLRPQEIHQAKVRHYQSQSGTLVFERKNSKGKKRRRVVPLNPVSVEIVESLVAQRTGPDDHIFVNTAGHPWCKDSVNCRMRRLREKLNMPGLCAYVLRHSFCHASLTQGSDPMAVAKAIRMVWLSIHRETCGLRIGTTTVSRSSIAAAHFYRQLGAMGSSIVPLA